MKINTNRIRKKFKYANLTIMKTEMEKVLARTELLILTNKEFESLFIEKIIIHVYFL